MKIILRLHNLLYLLQGSVFIDIEPCDGRHILGPIKVAMASSICLFDSTWRGIDVRIRANLGKSSIRVAGIVRPWPADFRHLQLGGVLIGLEPRAETV